jgi:hypothetical protein
MDPFNQGAQTPPLPGQMTPTFTANSQPYGAPVTFLGTGSIYDFLFLGQIHCFWSQIFKFVFMP